MHSPTDAELEDRFRYHAPTTEAARRHNALTETLLLAAKAVRDLVPPGRGQSVALTKLEEARMWGNQGIATNHAALEE